MNIETLITNARFQLLDVELSPANGLEFVRGGSPALVLAAAGVPVCVKKSYLTGGERLMTDPEEVFWHFERPENVKAFVGFDLSPLGLSVVVGDSVRATHRARAGTGLGRLSEMIGEVLDSPEVIFRDQLNDVTVTVARIADRSAFHAEPRGEGGGRLQFIGTEFFVPFAFAHFVARDPRLRETLRGRGTAN